MPLFEHFREIRRTQTARLLDDHVLGEMNQRLKFDFRGVRVFYSPFIETGAAFGKDLFFGDGQYAPETKGGMDLLAHELTHVIQQREGGGERWISTPDDEWEQAARVPAFLEPAPVGIYFGTIPRPQQPRTFDSLAARVGELEPNRLAMAYLTAQQSNPPNSLTFREAAEQSLMIRISSLYPITLIRLIHGQPWANRPGALQLITRARNLMDRYLSGDLVPPGALVRHVVPMRYDGPSISAGNGGGRPLTAAEQDAAARDRQYTGNRRPGDPYADNLADYLGRAPQQQTLDAIRSAGPIGAIGALFALIAGQDDQGIRNAIAVGALVESGVSSGPVETPGPHQDRPGIAGDRPPRR